MKSSLRERILRADELASRYLADANEASEKGQMERAERLYEKAQFWLDRWTLLTGRGDRPGPRA